MQDTSTLILEERAAIGSRAVRKIREQGYVPGVIYGHDQASQVVQAPYPEVVRAYHKVGKHSPVELQVAGKKRLAMVKHIDVEPVKHQLRHISFYIVKQNEKVQTEVSIHLANEGETPAEKAGLVLIKNADTVQIEALPRDLPEYIDLSTDTLEAAGDHLTVADLKAPQGVTILSDPTQQIVSAVEPAALAAANDAAGGPAEDEVETAAEAEEGAETTEAATEEAKE